jgi:hypothetical protein
MTPIELTPALLASVLAAILSLAGTYIPGLNTWLAGLATEVKQAIMGGLTILIGVVVYVLACTPSIGFPYVVCPVGGIWELVGIILSALTANQVVFMVSPKPNRVRAAKAAK